MVTGTPSHSVYRSPDTKQSKASSWLNGTWVDTVTQCPSATVVRSRSGRSSATVHLVSETASSGRTAAIAVRLARYRRKVPSRRRSTRPASAQRREMARDGAGRQLERGRDLAGRPLGVPDQPEDLPPDRRCERFDRPLQSRVRAGEGAADLVGLAIDPSLQHSAGGVV